ncbi:aspartate ammonia-lyase [Microbacterium hibisci]|uniref:aspartate ammonia-lyase n=1 Tax=Microbacterium hibisci TaxID=2036000 RepID=UPI0019409A53|nr:aspartate ammonia-lyase [Microbacterium hibisci]
MTESAPPTRREHDVLGGCDVPAEAYWGVHTARAMRNFRLGGDRVGDSRALVRALGQVKKAAARANRDLGLLDPDKAFAIDQACDRVIVGDFDEQFPVSLVQGGAGTSTNMNANEVIANIALEHLGYPRGAYEVLHPNEHLNLGQSTNDVYPTAVKLALLESSQQLLVSMQTLKQAFGRKAAEFRGIVKVGRTQLQDAVPMTLGQEFRTYEIMIGEDQARLREAMAHLHEINLGATAIGTGVNTHPQYAELVRGHLEGITELPLVTAADLVEATQDCGAFVLLSATVKRAAVKMSKVCNDLRLLSSGPRAGLAEISLPARQAGSSIMPGKVNPVIPELVNQVAFEIIGLDLTVTVAAEAGQLQLNAFEPVIASSLLRGIRHLAIAFESLALDCVDDIHAQEDNLREFAASGIGLATALSPVIGYAAASEVATEAMRSRRSVLDVVLERGYLSSDEASALIAGGLTLN